MKYDKGLPIRGLENFKGKEGYYVFHAGTKFDGDTIVTNGGRVLMVLASAPDLKSAHDKALSAVERIGCENLFHRTDIGHWAL